MNYKDAKEQFDYWTDKLDLIHTFTFDEAWAFSMYRRDKNIMDKPLSFKPSTYTKKEFQNGIKKVESLIRKNDNAITDDDIDKFNPLKHSFAHGCYIREVFNPAGELLITKIHKYSHPYFLLKGEMTIMSENGEEKIKAPHYGITKANTKRIIYAHTDCIFVTVHATDLTDINEIEKEVIRDDFKEEIVE